MSKKLNRLENLNDAINYDSTRTNEDKKSTDDKNEEYSEQFDEDANSPDPDINMSPKSQIMPMGEHDEDRLMSKISLVGDNVLAENSSKFTSLRNLKHKLNFKLKLPEKIDQRWNYLKINFYHIGML